MLILSSKWLFEDLKKQEHSLAGFLRIFVDDYRQMVFLLEAIVAGQEFILEEVFVFQVLAIFFFVAFLSGIASLFGSSKSLILILFMSSL